MSAARKPIEILDELITAAADRGVIHLVDESERLDGRRIRVAGGDLLHFGPCSNLGLELAQALGILANPP